MGTLLAKRRINREQYVDVLERQGLPDDVIQPLAKDVYRELSQGDVSELLRLHDLTDQEIAARLELDRWEPADILEQVLVTRLATLRREQLLRNNTVLRAHRQSLFSDARARAELQAARQPTDYVSYRLEAMTLVREVDQLEDTRDLVLAAVSKGVITAGQGGEQLAGLGMDPTRVRLQLLRSKLNLAPRSVNLAIPTAELTPALASEEG